MSPVLVDSNVLIDVATTDARWSAWSAAQLARLADETRLVINPIVFAEVSLGFARIEELDEVMPPSVLRREALPWEAAFLAGKAFVAYRRRGGARTAALPDFYIGAHAAIAGYRLLTRDAARYRTYFPNVPLTSPR